MCVLGRFCLADIRNISFNSKYVYQNELPQFCKSPIPYDLEMESGDVASGREHVKRVVCMHLAPLPLGGAQEASKSGC